MEDRLICPHCGAVDDFYYEVTCSTEAIYDETMDEYVFSTLEPNDNGHDLFCSQCGNDIDEQRMLEIARYELANGVYTLVTEGYLLDDSVIKRYEFNDEGFNKAYTEAKEAWDKGKLSKCMIILVEDDQPFMYRRPDMFNFEDHGDKLHL